MKKYFTLVALCVLAAAACTKETTGPKEKGESNAVKAEKGNLVLNECCGVATPGKFVELYNPSDKAVSLEGCKMYKGDDAAVGEFVVWVGQKGMEIEAKGFLALDADGAYIPEDTNKRTPLNDQVYETNFMTGFSPKKSVQFRLVSAEGVELDKFARGAADPETGFWGVKLTETLNASYSRVPDGTGEWVLAAPTKGTKNGEKTGDITL